METDFMGRREDMGGMSDGLSQTALPAYHTTEKILSNPRLAIARRAYVHEILKIYEHDPLLNRLLNDAGRGVVSLTLLSLHAAFDENVRATWPTMRQLQQTVALYGVSSARRVNDIVSRLIRAGFVTARAAPSDKRARILEPTAKLIAHDLDWLRAHYVPLDLLFPRPGYELPVGRDPAYRKAHRAIGSQMARHGAKIMDMSSEVMLFMSRDAGIMILFKLMERAFEETGAGASQLALSDIGDRFGVTRTHVRKVLKDAEDAGLVEVRGRQFSPTRALSAGFDRFFAEAASGHDLMHRLALQLIGR
jgi:DNA-binding MarR family transcriptional regulator